MVQFVRESGLYEVQVPLQTPFPGTPLYNRLEGGGRLLDPGAWEKHTLFDVTFQPLRHIQIYSFQLSTRHTRLVSIARGLNRETKGSSGKGSIPRIWRCCLLFSNKSAAPPISARRRHRPSPLHLPDHGEMLLDDRESIRRRASKDWIGAAPLIARKQIDRLNMGVELLTEIGSIECRSWRRGELPQKVPVRRVQNGWRRTHSVSGEHRVHTRRKRGVIRDHLPYKAPYRGVA